MAVALAQTFTGDLRQAMAAHERYCVKDGRHRPECPICAGDKNVKPVTTRLTIISRQPVVFDGNAESFKAEGTIAVITRGANGVGINAPKHTGVTASPGLGGKNPSVMSSSAEQEEALSRQETKKVSMGDLRSSTEGPRMPKF